MRAPVGAPFSGSFRAPRAFVNDNEIGKMLASNPLFRFDPGGTWWRSKLRNRVMSRVFHELKLIEQWDSDIHRMINACREAGLLEPEVEEIEYLQEEVRALQEQLSKRPRFTEDQADLQPFAT